MKIIYKCIEIKNLSDDRIEKILNNFKDQLQDKTDDECEQLLEQEAFIRKS